MTTVRASKLIGSLSVRTRVFAAFASTAVALLFVSVVALAGLEDAADGTARMAAVQERAAGVLELVRSVADLQRNVQAYGASGNSVLAEHVRANLDDVRLRIDTLNGLASSETERALVARIAHHVENYRSTFDLAAEERATRSRLVNGDLRTTTRALEDALTRLEAEDGEIDLVAQIALRIENDSLRYLDDPDSALVRKIHRNTEDAVALLRHRPASPPREEAISLLLESDRQFSRIAQATRGYLYLTSVVMAGEAMELRYLAKRLRHEALADADEIKQSIVQQGLRTRQRTAIITIIALLLGLLIAAAVSASISQPIARLTETFRRLAAGDVTAQISTTNRTDEIGVMVQAARVFSAKNRETSQLLEQARDLTEELEMNRADLAETNAELEQFVYTVSHDLKSPIVTAMGFLGLMQEEIDDGDYESAASFLPRLVAANERMALLVDDLLDLSRIGRADTEVTDVDLDALVANVLAGHDARIAADGVHVDVAPLPHISGNESRLIQVFDNLVTNAMKYGRSEEGVHIAIGAHRDERETRIYVRDNGPGIPEKYHEKVFGLFQRLHADANGTGIGLSIVQKIVLSHQGRIWIDSMGEQDGCTIWMSFPNAGAHETRDAG